MTHVTCRLTAKNRDQLRNPTLGNRVWASFTHTTPTVRRVGVKTYFVLIGYTHYSKLGRSVLNACMPMQFARCCRLVRFVRCKRVLTYSPTTHNWLSENQPPAAAKNIYTIRHKASLVLYHSFTLSIRYEMCAQRALENRHESA